jgi:hypothetical protein
VARTIACVPPTDLELLAESPNTRMPLGPNDELLRTTRYSLWLGPGTHPGWTVVQQVRVEAAELPDVLEEVRGHVRERGRTAATWELGNLSTAPADVADRLLDLGLVPDDEPLAVGMVLTSRPPEPPPQVTARSVETLEEYCVAADIQRRAFGMTDEQRAREAERDRERWDERATSASVTFLAWVDGEPAAAATGTYADAGAILFGGGTLPEARGRGAYRALVRARWDEAEKRGRAALVTQAGRMSRPILRGLGFREVAEIRILRDDLPAADRERDARARR